MASLKLSPRLSAISNMVADNSTVYDIGCDHAYLDIYLTKNRHNIKCLAIDKNDRVLNSTKTNIEKYNLQNKIEIIQSDGLNNLNIEDDGTIVVSGLGALTILDILYSSHNKLSKILIIQSNNEVELLRKEIVKLGYYIEDEVIVKDKDKYYIIIKFIKGFKQYKKIDYLLGPILKYDQNYLLREIKKYKKILINIPNKYVIKKLKLKLIIHRIKKML